MPWMPNITVSLSDIVSYERPAYSVIPIAWAVNFITICQDLIIISYLRSKPTSSKTIMDFMNAAFFIGRIPWSTLMTLHVTLLTLFQDSGEVLGSLVAYSTPAFGDNLICQLTAIFIVQAILVKKPNLMENEYFDMILKCVLIVFIPGYTTCLYWFAYLTGIQVPFYNVIRGMKVKSSFYWSVLRLFAMLPLLIGFIVSRGCLRMHKTERNVGSNHILNTTGVLFITIGQMIIGVLVFVLIELRKLLYYAKMLPLGSLILSSIFGGIVIISHGSVRNHMCRFYPFNILSREIAIRQRRQVTNRVPLHELKL